MKETLYFYYSSVGLRYLSSFKETDPLNQTHNQIIHNI